MSGRSRSKSPYSNLLSEPDKTGKPKNKNKTKKVVKSLERKETKQKQIRKFIKEKRRKTKKRW